MNNSKHPCGAVCRALLALAAAAPLAVVVAQTPPAEGASASSGTLEEVVVTARRRAESLQSVPLAVTALNAEQLQTQNVQSLTDVTAVTPNIEVNAGRATSSTINVYIRGVGQSDPLWGNEPGVGIYLDDVYIARPQGALLDLYDVDRIEVLRGPQGTLYGKNTIGGAIKYITRDISASNDPYLIASATGGSYAERDLKVAGSLPIVPDHVYFGLAGAYLRHDGWGEIVDDGLPRPYNRVGQDVSDKNVLTGRANLTLTWGKSSKLKLLADTMDDRSNEVGGQRLAADPYLPTPLTSRFDTYTNMPVDKDRAAFFGYSGTYTQDLTDALSYKAVAAYRQGQTHQFINFSELDAPWFEVPGAYADHETTGELQLTYAGSQWKGVAGLYYFNGTASGAFDAVLGLGGNPLIPGLGLPPGITQLTKGGVITNSYAGYFDTTWNLTPRLEMDVGARWNEDQKTATVYVSNYYAGTLVPGTTLFDPSNPPAGFIPLGAPETNYTNRHSFVNVSPRFGFDFHFTDEVMGYVTYSRGFKSGGFDMRGNQTADPGTANGYQSEIADSYEAGVKSTLLDKRLTLNLTVFYSPYKDVQLTTQQFELIKGAPTNVTAVLNAGTQLNKGVEFESVWRPIQPLTFTTNIGYLDAYFQDFLVGCTPPAAGCHLNVSAQNRPVDAPRWTGSLAGVYVWNLGNGELSAHSTYRYQGFTKIANTAPSVTDQGGYSVLDAGLAYAYGRNWRFAVEGKNILDKAYMVAGYDFGGFGTGLLGGLSQIGYYGAPRTILATATYHF